MFDFFAWKMNEMFKCRAKIAGNWSFIWSADRLITWSLHLHNESHTSFYNNLPFSELQFLMKTLWRRFFSILPCWDKLFCWMKAKALTPLKKVLTFSVLPFLFIIFYFLFICVALSLQLTGGCRPLQHHFYISMRLFLCDRLQLAQVHSGTWSLRRLSLNVCLETLMLKYVCMQ